MNILITVILGIVQGIGEFLPISSSAHLLIVRFLFGVSNESTIGFDVALHFGTLIAVMVVFWKEWISLFKGAINKVAFKKSSFENNMFWYLVLATIPGAIVGILLEDVIDGVVRENMLIVAIALSIMGIIIYLGDKFADKKYKTQKEFEELTLKQTLIIGLSQAFAVIPGFSRSGTTIVTARLMGIKREAAAKFTFLLSAPIIFGATVIKLKELILGFNLELLAGIVTSAIVGIIAIKFLLKYIKTKDFAIFAYYRVIIAAIVIIKYILVR